MKSETAPVRLEDYRPPDFVVETVDLTFRLALCAVRAAGTVEPHQLGVGGRVDLGDDLERERAVRHVADGETVRRGVVAAGLQRPAVDCD